MSKREAALRIAEEKLLEQEHSISQARLAASRSEGSLRQREQDVQRESEVNIDVISRFHVFRKLVLVESHLYVVCSLLYAMLWVRM